MLGRALCKDIVSAETFEMRALFITTKTVDCANHVSAWDSMSSTPAVHITYDHHALCNDWQLTAKVEEMRPDVIFWIGASKARGNPRSHAFRAWREVAPTVLICSDATDKPWHPVLAGCRTRGDFDLMVAIDGGHGAPVDLATLTPVDARPFSNWPGRNIRCGFSGNVGRWNSRSEIVSALKWFGGLTVRERSEQDPYSEHVNFLMRCQMLLNISVTGTGHAHHIKGRVLEAGWAGCALLESEGSPIGKWFPPDCYITYSDPIQAAWFIKHLPHRDLERCARRLAEEVRQRFTAAQIYGEILHGIGLNVDSAVA